MELDESSNAFVQVPWVGDIVPAIDPDNLDKVIPLAEKLVTLLQGTYPTAGYPSEQTSQLTIPDSYKPADGFKISITRTPLSSDTSYANYTYKFKLPTWDDGSVRFLIMDVCFGGLNGTQRFESETYIRNGSKALYLQCSHPVETSSNTFRTISHIRLPIKSGVTICISLPDFSTSPTGRSYIPDAGSPRVEHLCGIMVCG